MLTLRFIRQGRGGSPPAGDGAFRSRGGIGDHDAINGKSLTEKICAGDIRLYSRCAKKIRIKGVGVSRSKARHHQLAFRQVQIDCLEIHRRAIGFFKTPLQGHRHNRPAGKQAHDKEQGDHQHCEDDPRNPHGIADSPGE